MTMDDDEMEEIEVEPDLPKAMMEKYLWIAEPDILLPKGMMPSLAIWLTKPVPGSVSESESESSHCQSQ